MTYGMSEDELRKKKLREEADHDEQVALERKRAQEKAQRELHDKHVHEDIERLVRECDDIERDIRALDSEDRQLDATIRTSRSDVSRDAQRAVQKREEELRHLQMTLADLEKSEVEERDASVDAGTVRQKRDALGDLKRTEHETEGTITKHERELRDLEQELSDVKRQEQLLERHIQQERHELDTLHRQLSEAQREEQSTDQGVRASEQSHSRHASELTAVRSKKRQIDHAILEAKRKLSTAVQEARGADEKADKARNAKAREDMHDTKRDALKKKLADLRRKIEVLRRGLTLH